jgi:hypothetical protein
VSDTRYTGEEIEEAPPPLREEDNEYDEEREVRRTNRSLQQSPRSQTPRVYGPQGVQGESMPMSRDQQQRFQSAVRQEPRGIVYDDYRQDAQSIVRDNTIMRHLNGTPVNTPQNNGEFIHRNVPPNLQPNNIFGQNMQRGTYQQQMMPNPGLSPIQHFGNPGGSNPPGPDPYAANRDNTALGRLTRAITEPVNGTYMTQVLPANDHIILTKLTASHVIQFLTKVYDFCTAHQVSFKLTSKVTGQCRDQIISRNEGFIDEVTFNVLSNEALLRCLQRTVQPRSRDEFVMVMTRYVRFNLHSNNEISVRAFQEFYDALSSYKRQWLLYFDFMSYENAPNVPHCNTKENGLISLFIKPIPGDYAKNRYNTLMNRKYHEIRVFISDMWTQVQMDYERFKQYQTLTTVVGDTVPGIDPPPKYQKTEERKTTPSPTRNPFENRKTPAKFNPRHALNLLGSPPDPPDSEDPQIDNDQEQYEHSFDQEAEGEPPSMTKDSSNDEDDDIDPDREAERKSVHEQLNALDKPYKRGDNRSSQYDNRVKSGEQRNKIPVKPELKKDRNGCWNILRDGICENPNCKFSHDPEDLKKSWANLDQMLKQTERKFGAHTERKPGGTPATNSD